MKQKRLVAGALAVLMAGSLAGCGKGKPVASTDSTNMQAVATTEAAQAENMIENGDFSAGQGNWLIYTNGGAASLSVEDEELKVHVSNPGTLDYAIQPYYDGFALDGGCVYEMQFDVHSDVERTLEWRIQVNGGDYHAYTYEDIEIGQDVTHVDYEFTMNEGSDPAPRLCINMGMVEGCPEDLGEHNVYFDNFELYLRDASNIVVEENAIEAPDVLVNQLGFFPNEEKYAIVRSADGAVSGSFDVVDAKSGDKVFGGDLTDAKESEAAEEYTAKADFSELKTEGEYKVVTDYGESYAFKIGDDVYDELSESIFDMFRMQRCGEELDDATFGHPACHTEDAIIYGTEEKVEVTGGWHDAGDYGRYVVPGAKAVADLLLAYEFYGDIQTEHSDILTEAKYELDWMLKMQDPKSGGVYHKVSGENFPETVMPEGETAQMYLSPISVAASADFAASMAMASRIYKDTDPEYAKTMLDAAKKAYAYAKEHQDNGSGFTNPGKIVTGEYNDIGNPDELFWAAAELYKTTKEAEYLADVESVSTIGMSQGLGWQSVWNYGYYAYLSSADPKGEFYEKVQKRWDSIIDTIVKKSNEDSYAVSLGVNEYVWGSNMTVANNGMMLLLADQLDPHEEYKEIAKRQLNYVLGTNTTGYCFVTGAEGGDQMPEHPHHRVSQVVGEAVPGMLIGGPDQNLEDPYAKATMKDLANAACYADSDQSYSCNEITIYWNSPLVFLVQGVNADK